MEFISESYGLNFLGDFLHLLRYTEFIRECDEVFKAYEQLCNKVDEHLSLKLKDGHVSVGFPIVVCCIEKDI